MAGRTDSQGAQSEPRLVCIVSDATGATAQRVVRATLEQFEGTPVELEVVPHVTTIEQLRAVVERVAERKGFIAYTLVQTDMRSEMALLVNEYGVLAVDVMGPLLSSLSTFLAAPPAGRPGFRFDHPDDEHFERLEAVSFTVCHDDGMNLHDVDQAQVVVVGPSRTSKTPLCAYLAHTRGLRAANVPLALGVEPPEVLKQLPRGKVVGLTMHPQVLSAVRRERLKAIGTQDMAYADLDHIRRELAYCHEIYRRPPAWPVIDVTNKSIEEVAKAVCAVTVDAPRYGS